MAKRFATSNQTLGRGPAFAVSRSLVVLLSVALALTIVGFQEGEGGLLHGVRGVFQTAVLPVRALGAFVVSPAQGLGNVFTNLTADSESLTELEAENEQLRAEVIQLSEYEHDVETLTSLLELRNANNLVSTAAHVVSLSTDSWSSTLTIDKGTSSGLAIGMPVTSSAGVIGQISECGVSTATVRLISDENYGVSAMVQSSRAQGQLVGSPDATLRLTMIRTDQQVSVGDAVVTSGLGGVYPKGLPIGTVSNVMKTEGALYYDITVEPLSSASNLETVLVITSVDVSQQALPEEAEQADSQDRSTADVSDTTQADADAQATTQDGEVTEP